MHESAAAHEPVAAPAAPQAEADAPQAPAPPVTARPRRHRRVVRVGVETESVAGLSADEAAQGWSEGAVAGGDSNDAQLRRDVPPHW